MERGNHKRARTLNENFSSASNGTGENWGSRRSVPNSDVFAVPKMLERLADGKYGSVTKEYESLKAQVSSFISALSQSILGSSSRRAPHCTSVTGIGTTNAVVQDDIKLPATSEHPPDEPGPLAVDRTDVSAVGNAAGNGAIIVIDLDEDDKGPENAFGSEPEPLAIQLCPPNQQDGSYGHQGISVQYEKVNLMSVAGNSPYPDLVDPKESAPIISPFLSTSSKTKVKRQRKAKTRDNLVERKSADVNTDSLKINSPEKSAPCEKYDAIEGLDAGEYLHPPSPENESPTQNDYESSEENDGLGDLWQDMSLAMEFSKADVSNEQESEDDDDEECDHLFVLKDDLGVVCRVCGIIQKRIEKIVDYQLTKGSRNSRGYSYESRKQKDLDGVIPSSSGLKSAEDDIRDADIAIHPRHEKQMKPHQMEGFRFLVRNLVADNPGGCILAHAPGSGKTFMLISFIQSFLAKYPSARPLVVLPKGILPTWKMEFKKWQVEEIPLYDFYSVKADNRSQQLDVLRTWEENRSILFLGYKQFANIVCGDPTTNIAKACQEKLLTVPFLLIIDEGHTPRNDNTDVLDALSRVQTPRKVVLSGTLYQNHVKEVFNILNLVRPKFLKMELSRAVVARIMNQVRISGGKKLRCDTNACFYDLVEETLQCDSNLKRKVTIIRELREMTQHVLHYYKGDFLDELPGILDFTVLLKLSTKQKEIIKKMGKMDKFRRSAVCRAIYMHPYLNEISENIAGDRSCSLSEDRIDNIIDNLEIRDGVKTKFFLNVLAMSVSAGEKLLVFSQYLLPLKFLERLVSKRNGWRSGKEIFMISGDSSPDQREYAMAQFNSTPDAKVFFGSIKACGEGISLVGASRVIILDVHLNPSVSRQAIGRAFRPGQTKKVYVYRLVAADSPEEEDHNTSFRKELTSKMWFEWSEYTNQVFEMGAVDVQDSEDMFFESSLLAEDVKCLYRR